MGTLSEKIQGAMNYAARDLDKDVTELKARAEKRNKRRLRFSPEIQKKVDSGEAEKQYRSMHRRTTLAEKLKGG